MNDLLEPLVDSDDDVETAPVSDQTLLEFIYDEMIELTSSVPPKRKDLFQNMFPHRSSVNDKLYWWLPYSHGISMLLINRGYKYIRLLPINEGTVTIWSDGDVQEIMDFIVKECNEMGKTIEDDDEITVTETTSNDQVTVTINV